jgi:hypothetical protein
MVTGPTKGWTGWDIHQLPGPNVGGYAANVEQVNAEYFGQWGGLHSPVDPPTVALVGVHASNAA